MLNKNAHLLFKTQDTKKTFSQTSLNKELMISNPSITETDLRIRPTVKNSNRLLQHQQELQAVLDLENS